MWCVARFNSQRADGRHIRRRGTLRIIKFCSCGSPRLKPTPSGLPGTMRRDAKSAEDLSYMTCDGALGGRVAGAWQNRANRAQRRPTANRVGRYKDKTEIAGWKPALQRLRQIQPQDAALPSFVRASKPPALHRQQQIRMRDAACREPAERHPFAVFPRERHSPEWPVLNPGALFFGMAGVRFVASRRGAPRGAPIGRLAFPGAIEAARPPILFL